MANVINAIRNWQEERGLASQPYNPRTEIKNIVEELLEAIGCKDDDITKWITEEIMMHENILEPPIEDEKVDAYCDIIVFAIGAILKLGYEPNLALKETVKEINSRKQDPEQITQWHKKGKTEGEKWQKWKEQPKESLYKANYSVCKRSK